MGFGIELLLVPRLVLRAELPEVVFRLPWLKFELKVFMICWLIPPPVEFSLWLLFGEPELCLIYIISPPLSIIINGGLPPAA